MNDTAPFVDTQQHHNDAQDPIGSAARQTRAWDVVLRPTGSLAFSERVRAARRELRRLETELARRFAESQGEGGHGDPVWSGLQEIRPHVRVLRSAIQAVAESTKTIALFPRVVTAGHPQEPRIAALARLYFDTIGAEFSAGTFRDFIRACQEYEPLNVDELWNLPLFMQFVQVESLLDRTRSLGSWTADAASDIAARMKSLRAVANLDQAPLIEPLIVFDPLLREDPAQAYPRMDFESRELYRRRVAYFARYSDCTEREVALAVLELARANADRPASDPRVQLRQSHVGFFLIDGGFAKLAERVGLHPPLMHRARRFVRENGEDFFITGIQLCTLLVLAAVLFPVLPHIPTFVKFVVAVFVLLIPAMQGSVEAINNLVTSFFEPEMLPKLDFSEAIPAECVTMVAVPTLLLNEEQVRGLVNDLEVRYLANRDPHLHFALLTDLADSVSKPRENDSHPLVELATQLIDELNRKHAHRHLGGFLLLHRHRVFNGRQGVWMGWERKRGKLLDLNQLLAHGYDAFPIKAGRIDALQHIRYIITLDSDTVLPRDSAARLVGAIAHPLNQAIIDPKLRIVTSGYGILQPRVGVTVRSTSRSRLAAIFSGQSGFDIYTRAISDPYQDMFGEGIFTGKGIYEVSTLHAVLDRRFPRNSLLSHDLIEGAYARAGLVTDVEIVDDYPSHYSAYSRRLHRWVRGDWQIVQWIFSRVPDESNKLGPNPISPISRWKILDNLRRSLVDPFFLILFVAGWLWMPGGPLYWTAIPLILLSVPALLQLCFSVGRALAGEQKGRLVEAFSGFGRTMLLTLLRLVFLPHQTLLAIDAIVRSMVRRFITGERLLEWETAAQAEKRSGNRSAVDRYLVMTPVLTVFLGVLVWFAAPQKKAIFCALPILVLWAAASMVAAWLDRPPVVWKPLSSGDERFLLGHALRIWRYFYQFSSQRHHYLIPDNVEEDGLFEAARVSPTNVGLLLNARQAACELGFITAPEFAVLTRESLATIANLEKYRGHLFNWYKTETLEPLDPKPFVSSVDSGNFVASLYTLHAGTRDLLQKPLFSSCLFPSLHAHWQMMQAESRLPTPLARMRIPASSASADAWMGWLPEAEQALSDALAPEPDREHSLWWRVETLQRVRAIRTLICDYLPWLLPEFAALVPSQKQTLHEMTRRLLIEDARDFAQTLKAHVDVARGGVTDARAAELNREFSALLATAIERLATLAERLGKIAEDAERLAEETDFAFLADPGRRILSIGYDVRGQKLHEACYDLLASEARMATFLAIARGDLPQQSWFKLGRDHAYAYDKFLLYSWTGTMFEYLMPALWMESYPGTLLARTQEAITHVQRGFAQSLGTPWGISESGFGRTDDAGHYQYHAFGIPDVALWFEANAGPVISPYSSFLALGADPHEALRNLRRMESTKWVGAFGFYEAADYSQSSRTPVLVREWMAHHQGMSLLAITNTLREKIVQRWFHENPAVQATEPLLHEIPLSRAALRARLRASAPPRAA